MISKQASILPRRLIRRYHTNDPFEIAAALDITVMECSDFQRQKGAFKVVLHNSFIFINAKMSDEMKRIVCAHELGHALLHRSLGKRRNALWNLNSLISQTLQMILSLFGKTITAGQIAVMRNVQAQCFYNGLPVI